MLISLKILNREGKIERNSDKNVSQAGLVLKICMIVERSLDKVTPLF